jgi:RHS repeat-associated protein
MAHHSTRHKATPHWHISGSSRFGMDVPTPSFTPDAHTSLTETTRELGHKQYEISNHLGNVLSVITDQKLPVEVGSLIVSYSAVVVTATDYSPFGVGLYGRSWSGEYRYGFNGKEVDSEGMGGGSSTYDYGFRIYNAQLGKFLSVDPLTSSYPWYTPYQFAGNKPIQCIDLDGKEEDPKTGTFNQLTDLFYASFVAAWNSSFLVKDPNDDSKTKVVEYGGVIVKVMTKDDLGVVIYEEYRIINSGEGKSGSYKPDYKNNLTPEMEVVGDFHTHPYSPKEVRQTKKLFPNFDGLGVPFSSGDFLSYGLELDKVGQGDIHFVVAGDVVYGLEITDVEKAKRIMTNDQFLMDVDHMDDEMPVEGDFGELSFQNLEKLIESMGGESEVGFKLHKIELNTKTDE